MIYYSEAVWLLVNAHNDDVDFHPLDYDADDETTVDDVAMRS
jgi:hypothetical protein